MLQNSNFPGNQGMDNKGDNGSEQRIIRGRVSWSQRYGSMDEDLQRDSSYHQPTHAGEKESAQVSKRP